MTTTRLRNLLKREMIASWWVFFFAILCFICYEQGVKLWNEQFTLLSGRLNELRGEKEAALFLQSELLLQIDDMKDPEWIELTLMDKLGVIPEGQKKVYFAE